MFHKGVQQCGEIFVDNFVVNLLLIVTIKEFCKSVII